MPLLKRGKWLLPSFVVALVLGVLIAVQFQAQQKLDKAKELNTEKIAVSTQLIDGATKETKNLEDEQKQLKQEIEDLSNQSGGVSQSLKGTITKVKVFTGETPVIGPGVHIEIDDRKETGSEFFNIITTFQDIVNVLREGGAEAIAINGQRIGPRTAIVMSGSANVLVNNIPISRVDGTHWEIDAIGDQDTLKNFVQNLSFTSTLNLYYPDVNTSIDARQVSIPGLKAVDDFNFAKPVQ